MKSFKLLGNCQVCGRVQAVNGSIAKHGYTVTFGWFNGVCSGSGHLPLQQDDSVTKQVVANIKNEIVELTKLVAGLKDGSVKPKTAPIAAHYKAPLVPFNDAPESFQKKEVEKHIRNAEGRMEAGQAHIEYITELSLKVKGHALKQEAKAEKAPYISKGEKRKNDKGDIFVCVRNEGARIYWTMTRGEKTFRSWTGTAAWRKLELVA